MPRTKQQDAVEAQPGHTADAVATDTSSRKRGAAPAHQTAEPAHSASNGTRVHGVTASTGPGRSTESKAAGSVKAAPKRSVAAKDETGKEAEAKDARAQEPVSKATPAKAGHKTATPVGEVPTKAAATVKATAAKATKTAAKVHDTGKHTEAAKPAHEPTSKQDHEAKPAREAGKSAHEPTSKTAHESKVPHEASKSAHEASNGAGETEKAHEAAKTHETPRHNQPAKPPVTAREHEAAKVPALAKKPAVVVVAEEDDEPVATFLERQKGLLEAERNNYTRQAEELRAQAAALALEHEPGDVQFDEEGGEGGTANVDRELDLHLSAQAQAAIEEIDAALAKIAAGTYGVCESCGNRVPKARLEAIPHARLCVTCKSGGLSARRQ